MPKMPKPWYRKDRGLWFIQRNGKQHNLGPDRELAFRRYYELMAQPAPQKNAATVDGQCVAAIIDAYLEWCQAHRSPATYGWYKRHAQSFVSAIPASLTVAEFKPFHVQLWIDRHPMWAPGNRRGAMLAIQRAFNWAAKLGHVDRNPVALLEKPQGGRREAVIRDAE